MNFLDGGINDNGKQTMVEILNNRFPSDNYDAHRVINLDDNEYPCT